MAPEEHVVASLERVQFGGLAFNRSAVDVISDRSLFPVPDENDAFATGISRRHRDADQAFASSAADSRLPRHGAPARIVQTDKDVIFFYRGGVDGGGGYGEYRVI